MLLASFIATTWIISGVAAWGLSYSWFQGRFPELAEKDRSADIWLSMIAGLIGGPFALIALAVVTYPFTHGWRLWGVRENED